MGALSCIKRFPLLPLRDDEEDADGARDVNRGRDERGEEGDQNRSRPTNKALSTFDVHDVALNALGLLASHNRRSKRMIGIGGGIDACLHSIEAQWGTGSQGNVLTLGVALDLLQSLTQNSENAREFVEDSYYRRDEKATEKAMPRANSSRESAVAHVRDAVSEQYDDFWGELRGYRQLLLCGGGVSGEEAREDSERNDRGTLDGDGSLPQDRLSRVW